MKIALPSCEFKTKWERWGGGERLIEISYILSFILYYNKARTFKRSFQMWENDLCNADHEQ